MIDYKKYALGESDYFSGINIVPFTDVVLVLLIIFMIAAPGLVRSGLDINLPGASTSRSQTKTRWQVAVDDSGNLFLNARPIKSAALKEQLKAQLEKSSDTSVVLNADQATEHGKVVEVLDSIRAAGVKKIYVGTVRK